MRQILHRLQLVAMLFLSFSSAMTFAQRAAEIPTSQILDNTLQQYCVVCHNETLRTADFNLEGVTASELSRHASALEKVLRRLASGEMPPTGMPRPSESARFELVSWLEARLDEHASDNPNPGSPAIHRLNRAEYSNAIRDLLGIDLDHSEDLPADDSGYGFDNIGDVLTVSPLHIEKYISAARRASRLAVGTLTPKPIVERYAPQAGTQNEAIDGLPQNERGGILFKHVFPFYADYTITIRVRGRRMPHMPSPQLDVRVDGERIKLIDSAFSNLEAQQGTRLYEIPLTIEAGEHEIAAGFLNEYLIPETSSEGDLNSAFNYSVDYALIGGPYATTRVGIKESQERIFICRPADVDQEEDCARKILSNLARRGYRGPVTMEDINPLIGLFSEGRKDGGSFEHGIEMALSGLLVSPRFLYRSPALPEGGKVNEIYELSDIDLASRLSFFLWSSIPDEELLLIAEEGNLKKPEILSAQIDRMLTDPKARALVDNFGGQWLHLRNVQDWTPDPERYDYCLLYTSDAADE